MRTFYDGDTYVSLPGNFKLIDQVVRIRILTLIPEDLHSEVYLTLGWIRQNISLV